MTRPSPIAIAGLLALPLIHLACSANKMHRPVSIQNNPGHSLAFIEFDDQGEMWMPEQLSRALAAIDQANQSEQGALLVAYVHGWRHNASEKSETKGGNVADFKTFLETIRSWIDAVEGGRSRPLVGVYLGWRGKSVAIPGLDLLSFYGRAGAARRVAGTSATEVILRLLTTAKENPRTRTIMMGHSFGGQIMERAVAQALVGDLTRSRKEYGLLSDLIVLVNPTAKSLQAKQFVEMLDRRRLKLYRTDERGRRYEVPIMVSMTSSADLVTRWAFPAGTAVSALFKNFRRYPQESCLPFRRQRSFYVRTPGHNRVLISHQIRVERHRPDRYVAGEMDPRDLASVEVDPETGDTVVSFDGEKHRFIMSRLSGAANQTPYWIVRVPKALIPGHSGFFTSNVLRTIVAIMTLTGPPGQESSLEVEYDIGVKPMGIATLEDGRVLFLDASRRIYQVARNNPTPLLRGCLPDVADRSSSIGFAVQGLELVAVRNRPSRKSSILGGEVHRTELLRVRVGEGELSASKMIEIESKQSYRAAAFDFGRKALFLAPTETTEIQRAFLSRMTERGTEKRITPLPKPWVSLPDASSITELLYSERLGALLVIDGAGGNLYAIRDDEGSPQVEALATSLGRPVGITVDPVRRRIYVGDVQGSRIWKVDCTDSETRLPPEVLVEGKVVRPSMLSVAADGTIWVGDPEAERIVALSPEGELLQVIEEIPIE